MRQIVLDTETTGLSAEGGDRIIELGCVELYARKLQGHNLHFYFNTRRDSHQHAPNKTYRDHQQRHNDGASTAAQKTPSHCNSTRRGTNDQRGVYSGEVGGRLRAGPTRAVLKGASRTRRSPTLQGRDGPTTGGHPAPAGHHWTSQQPAQSRASSHQAAATTTRSLFPPSTCRGDDGATDAGSGGQHQRRRRRQRRQ